MNRGGWRLALVGLAAAGLGCALPFGPQTLRGSGNVITETRDVSGFSRVVLSGVGQVFITQGDEESLTIETDDNLMPYIRTEVRGDTLEIGPTDDFGNRIPDPSDGIIFRLGVITLENLAVTGAADVQIDSLEVGQLEVDLSGAGNIIVDSLNADSLKLISSGAGNVEAAGTVETQTINLSGLGRYDGSDLDSASATVDISGAGGVKVWARDTLDVVISGAGGVEYYGSPDLTQKITGIGKVSGLGEK